MSNTIDDCILKELSSFNTNLSIALDTQVHDLRSPLAILLGLVEDLESGYKPKDGEVDSARQAVENIRNSLSMLKIKKIPPLSIPEPSSDCSIPEKTQSFIRENLQQSIEIISSAYKNQNIELADISYCVLNHQKKTKISVLVHDCRDSIDNFKEETLTHLEPINLCELVNPVHKALLEFLVSSLNFEIIKYPLSGDKMAWGVSFDWGSYK